MSKGEKPGMSDGPDFSSQNDLLDKRARTKRIVKTVIVIAALVTFFVIGLVSMISQGKLFAPKKDNSNEPVADLVDDTPVLSATYAVKDITNSPIDVTIENPLVNDAPTVVLADKTEEEEDVAPSCETSAGSLGWIICPIVNDLSVAIKDRYLDWVEPALQINTLLFGSNDNSAAYTAWNVFRTIANLAFVVVFLVIIFSQLTGVGIDNYGIKKILPKLIIGAILINCSYIICQLAIDVANILGYGIAGIFKWITANGVTMPEKLKVEGVEMTPQDMGLLDDGFIRAGGAVVAIIGALTVASVISQGMTILIPVFFLVISVFISMFSLIAILGIRQAASVLLVVASPLAFVCYMLPNTKKIFDKWFKAFQGLLLAFPACSALIYGGDMVGHILLATSNGSTWIMISAAAVSVAPVFFIPKLIRSSMGAIGNATANFSKSLGREISRRGNNSRFANEMRGNHAWAQQRRINLRRAGVRYNAETGEYERRFLGSGLYGLGRGGKERVARARGTVLRDYEETAQAHRMTGEGGLANFNGQVAAIDDKVNQQTVAGLEQQIKLNPSSVSLLDENGKQVKLDPSDINSLENALAAAMLNGEQDLQKALTNIMSKKGDQGREGVRRAIVNAESKASSASYEGDLNKFRESQKNVASHILDNFGDAYKENNRSTYDWAETQQSDVGFDGVDQNTGEATTVQWSQEQDNDKKRQWIAQNEMGGLKGREKAIEIDNIKQSSLLTMDDGEITRLMAVTGRMADTQENRTSKKNLMETIDKALSSEAATNAKIGRIEELKKLRDQLGSATPTPPPTPQPHPQPTPTPPTPPTPTPQSQPTPTPQPPKP